MTSLTRRIDPDVAQETWRIYYGDVRRWRAGREAAAQRHRQAVRAVRAVCRELHSQALPLIVTGPTRGMWPVRLRRCARSESSRS